MCVCGCVYNHTTGCASLKQGGKIILPVFYVHNYQFLSFCVFEQNSSVYLKEYFLSVNII